MRRFEELSPIDRAKAVAGTIIPTSISKFLDIAEVNMNELNPGDRAELRKYLNSIRSTHLIESRQVHKKENRYGVYDLKRKATIFDELGIKDNEERVNIKSEILRRAINR